MNQKEIKITDYLNLIQFFQDAIKINSLNISMQEICSQIQVSLSNLFDFDKSVFWLLEEDLNTYHAVTYQFEETIMQDYYHHFYKIDPFYPNNLHFNRIDSSVLSIDDLMTFDDYINSNYYSNFVKKLQLFSQAVIYIKFNRKIIGGISLMRSDDKKSFDKKELALMEMISPCTSRIIANFKLLNDLRIKKSIFQYLCDHLPIGVIILEPYSYRIQYINTLGQNYTSEISSEANKNNSIQHFINHFILNGNPHFCFTKTIYSPTCKEFIIKVTTFQNIDERDFLIYVYIMPKNISQLGSQFEILQDCSRLTPRQQEIIECVLQGYSNTEIAKELFISVPTVKTHLNNIYKELHVSNRLSLYAKLKNTYQCSRV